MGHRVSLVEVNLERLVQLQAGDCPIYEPGLRELLRRHLGAGLSLTSELQGAVTGARALLVCVGTPPQASGAPDLRALHRLLQDLRASPDTGPSVVVLKSTVPPGTNRMAYEFLDGRVAVVANPEFLREGSAIDDFFHPDRVVVGSPDEGAALLVAGLYSGVDAPLLVTGWEEAELIRYVTGLHCRADYRNAGSHV
jgi:UDPglucose 6-dehydrogenase